MRPNPFRAHWLLDPDVIFLNHGSFGACPQPVLLAQQAWRDRLERQPLKFLGREIEGLLDTARQALAAFVGANPAHLALVPNATTGVNAVLRSLPFQPGDQLLTTNQEYNACRNALNFVAERWGAEVVVADIPFPLTGPDQIRQAVLQKVTACTRLVLIDHVISQTAVVLPIADLVADLTAQGVDTLVDGAHAPGMIPLQLEQIGAAYYTGNCHKWLCAPKGAAFLYVRGDRQSQIHPLVISHGANDPRLERSRFHLEFDWMGTDDPTAYLAVPTALEFMGALLPGGWPALMQHNHQLAIAARHHLCDRLHISLPCPDSMVGAMASIPLPEGNASQLYQTLVEQFSIEVPIIPFPQNPHRLVRISAQIYNSLEEYHVLAKVLSQLLRETT